MTASSELRAAATKLRGAREFIGEDVTCWSPELLALLGSLVAAINPLAQALDLLADRWDTHDPVLDAMHQHDETAVGHHLLKVARQINGGGS